MTKEMKVETSNETTTRQPEPASLPEDGGNTCATRRDEIDIGSRTFECSVDGEWPRIHSIGGGGFIESGPGHYDMI